VYEALNWALTQIGKRNKELCRLAIRTPEKIRERDSASAGGLAADAFRELKSRL